MFKHNIAYTDFNGVERKEDFYFHLSSPEVTRLHAEIGMPIDEYTKQLAARMDVKELIGFMERIILSSYGRKTSDGKSFHKSKELREEFEYSQAYAELFEQMMNNPELAQRFGQGVADNGKARKNQVQPQVVPMGESPLA
jgi:hypothetical protein